MPKNQQALEDVVAETTDPKKFDLDKFIKAGAIALPTTTVDCLTDIEAGYEIAYVLNPQIDALRKQFDGTIAGEPDEEDPELKELTDRADELRQRIRDTRITFHLRGLVPAVAKIIEKKSTRESRKLEEDVEDSNIRQNLALLQATVTKIEFHKVGETVENLLTYDQTRDLVGSLPVDQANKLFDAMGVLIYGVVMSASTIDAGFPGRAAGEAGELPVEAGAADSGEEPAASI
jgi:hypothetical protein